MLCTQQEVEYHGQVDFTAEPDARVTRYIAAASAAVENYCGRSFIVNGSDVTETFDGRGRGRIQLSRWPNITITSVTEDGSALTEGDDFIVRDSVGQLIRTYGGGKTVRAWQIGLQVISVVYDGGYAAPTTSHNAGEVPEAVRHVAAQIAGRIYRAGAAWAATPAGAGEIRQIDLQGVGSAQFGPSSVAGVAMSAQPELLIEEKSALSPYVRRF